MNMVRMVKEAEVSRILERIRHDGYGGMNCGCEASEMA